jgi:nucleoid-associated protein YgaU
MGIVDSFKKALGGKDKDEAGSMRDADSKTAPAIAGGESAQSEPTSAVESEAVPDEEGRYTVQSGDTMWHIAETVYGDGSKYSIIFDANTDLLEHPDRIFPGQKLHIPDLDD